MMSSQTSVVVISNVRVAEKSVPGSSFSNISSSKTCEDCPPTTVSDGDIEPVQVVVAPFSGKIGCTVS